jgi:hypothetical protein
MNLVTNAGSAVSSVASSWACASQVSIIQFDYSLSQIFSGYNSTPTRGARINSGESDPAAFALPSSNVREPLPIDVEGLRGTTCKFFTRFVCTYLFLQKLIKFGKSDPNFLHTTLATHAEYAVLREYLRSSGFPEIDIDGPKLVSFCGVF